MLSTPRISRYRLGLVVKASASGAEDPGFKSRLRRDFSESSHTSYSKIGTPVATLPGAWRYRVSTGTGWPGVSILGLGEVKSLICNFYLSVAGRKIVRADPYLRYANMLQGRYASNQPTNKPVTMRSGLSVLSSFLSSTISRSSSVCSVYRIVSGESVFLSCLSQ